MGVPDGFFFGNCPGLPAAGARPAAHCRSAARHRGGAGRSGTSCASAGSLSVCASALSVCLRVCLRVCVSLLLCPLPQQGGGGAAVRVGGAPAGTGDKGRGAGRALRRRQGGTEGSSLSSVCWGWRGSAGRPRPSPGCRPSDKAESPRHAPPPSCPPPRPPSAAWGGAAAAGVLWPSAATAVGEGASEPSGETEAERAGGPRGSEWSPSRPFRPQAEPGGRGRGSHRSSLAWPARWSPAGAWLCPASPPPQ